MGTAGSRGHSPDRDKWRYEERPVNSKGLHLDQNENTRAWIDHRFWREMARICDDYYEAWYDKLDGEWESCEAWAKAFYAAVRNGARSAYY